MDRWLNLEIMLNPANWIMVVLVLIFAAFGIFTIYQNATAYIPKV
jgi:hypothetical protein